MFFRNRPLLPLFLLSFILIACNSAVENPGSVVDVESPSVSSEVDTDSAMQQEDTPPSSLDAETQPEDSESNPEPDDVESDQAAEVTATEELLDGKIPVGFTPEGHAYMGNLDAPVVIEEYSDYQCPYCARFHENTLKQFMDEYIAEGDVLLIYKDFPLNFHEQAMAASIAARCAGEQGAVAYWNMHDTLFENMGRWSRNDPEEVLIGLAADIGLDTDALSNCLADNAYEEQVRADLQSGSAAGVRGTPSFLINGDLIAGALPYQSFAQAVETVKAGGSIAAAEPEQQQAQMS